MKISRRQIRKLVKEAIEGTSYEHGMQLRKDAYEDLKLAAHSLREASDMIHTAWQKLGDSGYDRLDMLEELWRLASDVEGEVKTEIMELTIT